MIDFPITINDITIQASEIIPFLRKCESRKAMEYLIDKTNCQESDAREIIAELKKMISNTKVTSKANRNRDTFKTCPNCGKSSPYLTDHCLRCGFCTEVYQNRVKKEQLEAIKRMEEEEFIFCPKCHSKLITTIGVSGLRHIEPRNVCQRCGYEWRPGKS